MFETNRDGFLGVGEKWKDKAKDDDELPVLW